MGRCWDAVATPCCCAAIAVLWLALAPEKFPLQADTLLWQALQKWSLILPSSARVSELTYVTYSAQHMWWYELGVLLKAMDLRIKSPGLVTLA